MRRLIAGAVATGVVFGATTLYVDTAVSPATPVVLLLAGITFGALALTMLSSTRGWSLRAVGLFLMLTGVTVLLLRFWAGYQWGIDGRTVERTNDAVMAMWIVGIPLSLTGVCLYWLGGDRPE